MSNAVRQLSLTAVISAAALAFSSFPAAQAGNPAETFLFVETAERGTMVDGVLTLSGIDETVVCFSDRPFRHGEVVPALEGAAAAIFAVIQATEQAGTRELQFVAAQDDIARPSRVFRAEKVA